MSAPRTRRTLLLAAVAAVGGLVLVGCGHSTASGSSDATLTAVASFYPLQFVTEQVGGDLVSVSNLTKPGAEPHDLELSPQDLGALTDADLAVYLAGFQPAVDDAVAQKTQGAVLDVSDAADLSLTYDNATTDPHFWLDPIRLANVGDAVAHELTQLDPSHSSTFEANAQKLRRELETLDAQYTKGLQNCQHREIVTSHAAFGYLADVYDLKQIGITGLTPDSEPNPQDLANVTRYVEDHHVTTIYYEPLVSPDVAKTVADATGATTAVLDPIEGLSDTSQGDNYLEVMRANLANLRAGLSCR